MTNGYTKMRGKAIRTMSMDFSGLATFSSPPPPPPPLPPQDVLRPPRSQKPQAEARPRRQEEASAPGGEVFGVILSRTCSSSTSRRFAADNYGKAASAGGGLHAAVRRAFSMRKLTSSPADGYCRIHGTDADLADAVGRDFTEKNVMSSTRKKKTKKESRVVRACKRLFGF